MRKKMWYEIVFWILCGILGVAALFLLICLGCFLKVFYSPKRKPLGEAVRKPFKPERVRIPATGSAMAEAASMEPQSPDVQAAMEQMAAFQELGFGRFS